MLRGVCRGLISRDRRVLANRERPQLCLNEAERLADVRPNKYPFMLQIILKPTQ